MNSLRHPSQRRPGPIGSFWEGLFYIFRQKYWVLELLLSILLASIPILGYFLIKGWEFEISVRVRHDAPRLLPGWHNPFQKLFRGMIIRLAAFLYNLPTFILLGITIVTTQADLDRQQA